MNAQLFHVNTGLVERHKVLLVIVTKPHRMNIEVRDDNRWRAPDASLRLEPGNNLGWQEVRTNGNVRLVFLQEFDQWPRIESIERKSSPLVFPRLVQMIVQPAHGLRHPIHHIEISLRVEMPENFVCVIERVDMK